VYVVLGVPVGCPQPHCPAPGPGPRCPEARASPGDGSRGPRAPAAAHGVAGHPNALWLMLWFVGRWFFIFNIRHAFANRAVFKKF